MRVPGPDGRRRLASGDGRQALACAARAGPTEQVPQLLVEDVLEARAVAEAPQLDSHRRALRAVLGARDVRDVGLPAAGLRAPHEVSALAAPDSGRVLVAVHAGPSGPVLEQPLPAGIG